jgi:acyl carrier protein
VKESNMSLKEFVTNFAEAIELDPSTVTPETVFKDIDSWDSMAVLNVIAMVDDLYQKSIGGDDIEKSVTIADLWGKVGG